MNDRKGRIKQIVSKTVHKEIGDLDTHLIDDLNMDSLDAISFLFEVEREFDIEIPEEDIDKNNLFYLKGLEEYISSKLDKIN